MNKNLSKYNRLLLKTIFIIICINGMSSCNKGSGGYCGASSESVAIAKKLSNEQASDLYNSVKKFTQSNEDGRFKSSDETPIPSYLWNYEEVTLIPKGKHEAWMYLETCSLDYKVIITFDFPENGTGEMMLQWGGGPESYGHHLLWPK